jgi:GST-like protein
MSPGYTLLGQPGWGSALAEAALTLCELPFSYEKVEMGGGEKAREKLTRHNPLGEIPTLILPNGETLTESAAIMLYLADIAPGARLVPLTPGKQRMDFLRWLAFLVSAIYPTFTYGDEPSRYVSGRASQDELRAATDALRLRHWTLFEAAIDPAPWALGEFTALDLYVAVMVHWRPRKGWFTTHCPKIDAVADAALALPKLRPVWAHNGFIGSASAP